MTIALLRVLMVAYLVLTGPMLRAQAQVESHISKPVLDSPTFPSSHKEVLIRGWKDSELKQIASDFSRLYRIPQSFCAGLQLIAKDTWRITLSENFDSRLFFFFINYLNYPKGFNLKGHRIGVLGKTTISSKFNPPDLTLRGQKAIVYVPTGDTAYDLIYIHFTSGRTYSVSFTDMKWQRTRASKIPSTIQNLEKNN